MGVADGAARAALPPTPALDLGASPAADRRSGLLTAVARWLDEAALTSLCWAFDESLTPEVADPARLRATLAPYVTPALARDPAAFLAFDDAAVDVAPSATTSVARLPGGAVLARTFASDYRCFDAARDDPEARCAANAAVPVHHWTHDDGARGTVLALHGFTMGWPRMDAAVLQAARWYGAGLDVVLPALPFHGPRSPRFARHSGALFGSWDVGRLNEAVRQAVWDVRRIHRWLRRSTDRPIGLFGVSLGGYVAALLAELSDDLDFVMTVAPAVCLASLPCRLFARSRHGRDREAPVDLATLRRGYRVHSPLTHALRVAKERVLIVAGRGDRVVPPSHAEALWRHWGEPAIAWFSGSHFAPFGRPAIVGAGLAHLAALGIVG